MGLIANEERYRRIIDEYDRRHFAGSDVRKLLSCHEAEVARALVAADFILSFPVYAE